MPRDRDDADGEDFRPRIGRSASAILSELVLEAARHDARGRALEELGAGIELQEREVQRWLRKLGAA